MEKHYTILFLEFCLFTLFPGIVNAQENDGPSKMELIEIITPWGVSIVGDVNGWNEDNRIMIPWDQTQEEWWHISRHKGYFPDSGDGYSYFNIVIPQNLNTRFVEGNIYYGPSDGSTETLITLETTKNKFKVLAGEYTMIINWEKYSVNPDKSADAPAYLNHGTVQFISEGTTDITALQSVNASDGKYYTLSGTMVDNPEKGIYIHNGKKIIIK